MSERAYFLTEPRSIPIPIALIISAAWEKVLTRDREIARSTIAEPIRVLG
ncbi:MAG TPA: hypothetical protein O0W81_01480 [Methanocorpusculum sp.]|nr:hypothetical protein [Methanocorpusculum sp.]